MKIVWILLKKIENHQISNDFGHNSPVISKFNFIKNQL